jgi:hypothetical protein
MSPHPFIIIIIISTPATTAKKNDDSASTKPFSHTQQQHQCTSATTISNYCRQYTPQLHLHVGTSKTTTTLFNITDRILHQLCLLYLNKQQQLYNTRCQSNPFALHPFQPASHLLL